MGPTCRVLLPHRLTDSDREIIEEMRRKIGFIENENCAYCNTTRPIGGQYHDVGLFFMPNTGRRYGIHPDVIEWGYTLEDIEDESEIFGGKLMERNFGFSPQYEIGLWIGPNQPKDHLILADIAAYLAEIFGGIVDYYGGLYPPIPTEILGDRYPWDMDWKEIEPYFSEMTSSFTGKYLVQPLDGRGYVVYSDSEWLRCWSKSPNFRMVK
jgi:hypothetical protein